MSVFGCCGLSGWIIWFAGILSLTFFTLRVIQFLKIHFFRPVQSFSSYGAKDGAWAMITGASDGIGKEYAVQLAKKGFNVVLVSRTQAKLEAVEAEIQEISKVKTRVVVCDLANAQNADFDALKDQVSRLQIRVLINNAGMSHEMPEKFGEADLQRIRDINNVNVVAVSEITHRLLPVLLKYTGDGKRSLIVNIGSASGLLATPMLAPYAASKSYLAAWSTALQHEYRREGVDVDCPLPFFVVSNMSKRSRSSATVPTAAAYVTQSLNKMGYNDPPFAPYLVHGLMEFAIASVPTALSQLVVAKNHEMHASIRKAAIRKRERQAKSD